MTSKTKILIGVLIVGLFITGWWILSNNSNKIPAKYDDPKYCEKDEDCILISDGGCCSTTVLPVNIYHRNLERVSLCERYCDFDPKIFLRKSVCINNQCTLSEPSDIRGGTSESKCKELGGFVTCDSTPEGTTLDCLCCFENYPDDCRYVW